MNVYMYECSVSLIAPTLAALKVSSLVPCLTGTDVKSQRAQRRSWFGLLAKKNVIQRLLRAVMQRSIVDILREKADS